MGIGLVLMYIFQTKLIYVPNFPPDSRRTVWKPSKFGWKEEDFEDVEITSFDGTKLRGYWIKARKIENSDIKETSNIDKKSLPILIYFQGNAGNIGHRLPLLWKIYESLQGRANIALISFRGFGRSEGAPDQKGIQMDAQAILNWVSKTNANGTQINNIILYGQSIGGAIAFDLASRNPEKVHDKL